MIATGGGNLSVAQKDAVNAVIASGGGNVIASGGGNLGQVLLDGAQGVIATGGGNVIANQLTNQISGVIATGGGNLSTRLEDLKGLSNVIATGGGNVIAPSADALIGHAGGELIGQDTGS